MTRATWLALGAVVLLFGAGVAGWRALVLRQTAEEARTHLEAARTALSAANVTSAPETTLPGLPQTQLTTACAEASAAADSLRDVNSQLQLVLPLMGALESVPGLGARARSQAVTLHTGTQIATAGASLCDGLSPLTALLGGGSLTDAPHSASEVVRALTAARPQLIAALQRLHDVQQALVKVDEAELEPGNHAAVASVRERLPPALKTLRDATVLLDLLGAQGPRRYLVVSQNPDELRATGGFIGSAGIIEAVGGSVRLVEYGSSRRYDTPIDWRAEPPAPFRAYFGQDSWNLASANWWASYPDVARQLAYLYGLSRPSEPVDGVIALDQFGLARLLGALGSVDVPEYAERVDAQDLQAKLDRYVHTDLMDESGRKQFTAALSTAVLHRLLSSSAGELPAVIRAARTALDEQHLLMWAADPRAAELFASRRWDGAILPAVGDSLLLVDTDIVASKQSQSVTRDVGYTLTLTNGEQPRASLEVTYTNKARRDERPNMHFVPVYRTLLRVLVPAGASLITSSGFDNAVSVGEECGKSVFAGRVTMRENAVARVKLEYQLPATITRDGSYDLLVQQQPGVPPGSLRVVVASPGPSVALAELPNAPGGHGHWRLDPSSATLLRTVALPQPPAGGCGLPVVEAAPIAPPVGLTIPRVRLDAAVVDLGVEDDGQMEAPPTPDVVGWYRTSSRPGQRGNSVMSGHVDWGRKGAVFAGLRNLKRGDSIQVRGGDGSLHAYAVEWNQSFPWKTAPVDRIVGPSAESLLTLITCDGVYDQRTRQYSERRVVRARLVE